MVIETKRLFSVLQTSNVKRMTVCFARHDLPMNEHNHACGADYPVEALTLLAMQCSTLTINYINNYCYS